jgi:UDP-2,4-diacetamido-2,4,6-trideoxy-beta-L-altropyranose hydrolase
MKVVFRTDASIHMGTGHVIRCLTLAEALSARGTECQFICRMHEGNLIEFIRGKGYIVHMLPIVQFERAVPKASGQNASIHDLAHTHWLGATQSQDAKACAKFLVKQHPDWLIVDHYALDARWELALAPHYRKLMVIDDLADRPHASHLLLDQTFGRKKSDYRTLVPPGCRLMCGSQYALLRPEFASLRAYSLKRRAQSNFRDLLITMGGVDKDNATGQVLEALCYCPLPKNCRVSVVLGATAPWLTKVSRQAQAMPWPTRVLVGVSDMAQLMADSDLAIGAAGATSWERCWLCLPTILLVLAENQIKVAQELEQAGAAAIVSYGPNLRTQLAKILEAFASNPKQLNLMSKSSEGIVDVRGIHYVTAFLER